jgi:hypothetical protein
MKTASSRSGLGRLALLAPGAGILVASADLIHRPREFCGVDWSSMS